MGMTASRQSFWADLRDALRTEHPFDERMALRTCLFVGAMYYFGAFVLPAIQWEQTLETGWHRFLGSDFLSFYSASDLALAGRPTDVYDMDLHSAAQLAIFPKNDGYFAFFYPPLFLLLCYPLAALSYFAALAAWLAPAMAACFAVLRRWAPPKLGYLHLMCFPAAPMTIAHGQNAFITTALLGGAFLLLDRRPVLAGVLFGALAFKPHFGLLIPLVLLASGRWRTALAAGGTVAAFALASVAVFGVDIWRAYAAIAPEAARALEENGIGDHKMQSIFAMMRLFGSSVSLAYAAQAAVGLAAAAAVVWVAWKVRSPRAVGAVMVAGALLTTPFMLRYDLMLLAIPLAWLYAEATRTGFRPGEVKIGVAAFMLPWMPTEVAQYGHLLVAPLVIMALFFVVARRALSPAEADASAMPEPRTTAAPPASA
ncbi:glycosyltransferase family 87 protein [Alsobacter sp. SYSU BS001988]